MFEYHEEGDWIVPSGGSFGTKAQNLYNNSKIIKEVGFKIPRSLVIPYEHLQTTDEPWKLALNLVDNHFPDWMRLAVRSSASDEDLDYRTPGLYTSESIWHRDRDHAELLIGNVLESFDRPALDLRRKLQGLEDVGMSLLIQEQVCTGDDGLKHPNFAGVFSDLRDDGSRFIYLDTSKGLDGMNSESLERVWIDSKLGNIFGDELAPLDKLLELSKKLPSNSGKGWEVECVGNFDSDTYVVQTTPIHKSPLIKVDRDRENIFMSTGVYGTGTFETEGVLYLPAYSKRRIDEIVNFDLRHKNYCLVTIHNNINSSNNDLNNVLNYLRNPSVVLDINENHMSSKYFAPHVEQYLREGRIAMVGLFKNDWRMFLQSYGSYMRNTSNTAQKKLSGGILYSPTKLISSVDEISGEGIVSIVGEEKPFVSLNEALN